MYKKAVERQNRGMSSVKSFLEDGTRARIRKEIRSPHVGRGKGKTQSRQRFQHRGITSKKPHVHKERVVIWHYWSVKRKEGSGKK